MPSASISCKMFLSWRALSNFAIIVMVILMATSTVPGVSAGESTFDGPGEVANFVEARIEGSEIMVFSKQYCPFCKKTKALLKELLEQEKFSRIEMNVLELDQFADGGEAATSIQQYLLKKTGQRTVPNIFIGANHIGGNSDLQELHASGMLELMLSEFLGNAEKSNDEL
ncbi:glutathione peroxidase [Nitzschia inconspicua]|uniref:Glutathione peroxidase n=1 Tax=Nitzschia inconspicua TaxID=303405 RepID=A0A9K3PJ66_9STRA|nr:glutathione peroxidase [Nitzschia inconspicua]